MRMIPVPILLIIGLLFYVLPTVFCIKRAKKLQQSKVVWGILGFFLSYLAVLVAYLLSAEDTMRCPYCGEKILTTAKKCKHCGEWLENR